MEPASLALAVVGIFETCMKGYRILSDARRAPQDAQNAARRIRIEEAVLASWGAHFEIHSRHVKEPHKLKVFLKQGYTLGGVLDTLSAIAETFTDVRKMERKYNIVFGYTFKDIKDERASRDIRDLLDRRSPSPARTPPRMNTPSEVYAQLERYEANITILARCKWALRGKDRVQSLIKDLREYNDDLIRLCSWEAQVQVNRGLPTVALPGHNNFADLHLMADAAEDTATDKRSPSYEGRQRLASMARFKAKITTPPKVRGRWYRSRNMLDPEAFLFHSHDARSTLAIYTKDNTVVLVEWRYYSESAKHVEEEQIHILSDLLCAPNKPADFRTLPCLGIFKQSSKHRYGLVFELPRHVRVLSRPLQDGDLSIRKPLSLADLIKRIDSPIALGLRFRLAKQLMGSIIVIHASGWLHKNIHPRSIIFLPAEPSNGPKGQLKGYLKDISQPYIMGYTYSRPDDVGGAQAYTVGFPLPASKALNTDDDNDNTHRHPDKTDEPARRFRHAYDIYSLGLVLLEIGLWQSLSSFTPPGSNDNNKKGWPSARHFQSFVMTRLVPDLWGQCGAIYGGVVKECLTMRSDDARLDEEGQRRLCWNIAERLDMCVA